MKRLVNLFDRWSSGLHALALGVFVILVLVLFGSMTGAYSKVNKRTVRKIMYDMYTPKSMEYFNSRARYYVKKHVLTQDEASQLFISTREKELTEDDKERKLDIESVTESKASDNTTGDTMYRVKASLRYKGKTTRFEIIFSVDKSGAIYKHVAQVL